MSESLPPRIASLFAEAQRTRHRVLFVIVGLNSKRHIPLLHDTLNRISPLNDIVWCHKNPETAAESVAKKQKLDSTDSDLLQWLKKAMPDHLLYRDSHRILGKTCDMLLLQNFECLTPNTLITVIETVRGGGAIVLLLDSYRTLNEVLDARNELHSMSSSSAAVTNRFNRRLFKTLIKAENNVFVMDSDLRPITLITRNKHDKTTGEAKSREKCSDEYEMAQETVKLHKEQEKDTRLNKVEKRTNDGASDALLNESEHKHTPLEYKGPLEILLDICKTKDQANALQEAGGLLASDSSFVACITAARGRGKTALLGLISAFVLFSSPSSIAIAAPFLENVQPFFEHIAAGLARLGLRKQHDFRLHYTFIGKKRLISKLEVIKTRHCACFISTSSEDTLSHLTSFPLIFVDEAAAVPVNILKSIFLSQASNRIQNQRLFLSSTVGGYEGTGRAFKTKFLDFVAEHGRKKFSGAYNSDSASFETAKTAIKHISLDAPIRYGENDPLERWINTALLVNPPLYSLPKDLPLPCSTSLFYLNKAALFSGSALSEGVLAELYGVLAAGHYRNSPNDLQILADCENHGVFVLLGGTKRILAAAQIAFEGPIMSPVISTDQSQERTIAENQGKKLCHTESIDERSTVNEVQETICDLDNSSKHGVSGAIHCNPKHGTKRQCKEGDHHMIEGDVDTLSTLHSLSGFGEGTKDSSDDHRRISYRIDPKSIKQSREGNLVPWVIYENFGSKKFASSVGARIVRIVVHPQLQSMGYGTELLRRLENVLCACNSSENSCASVHRGDNILEMEQVPKISVGDSSVLFCGLERINVPKITWIGASFGLNESLTRFWIRAGYIPACVRQEPSAATGDFPGLVIKGVGDEFSDIVADMNIRFRKRFIALLSYVFRDFPPALCLSLLEERENGGTLADSEPLDSSEKKSEQFLSSLFIDQDNAIERLKVFSEEMSSARSVLDLFPKLVEAVFSRRGGRRGLSVLQQAVLIMVGAQHKTPGCVARLLEIKEYQVENLLRKTVETLFTDRDHSLPNIEELNVRKSQ